MIRAQRSSWVARDERCAVTNITNEHAAAAVALLSDLILLVQDEKEARNNSYYGLFSPQTTCAIREARCRR